MQSSILKVVISPLCVLFFFTQFSYASSQGSLGTTSSGDVAIEISLGNAAKISYIEDSDFPAWDGVGNETDNNDLCVYTNVAGGTYSITVTGDGPSSSFQVQDGNGNSLNYVVRWNDVAGTNSGGTNLTSGTLVGGQSGADTTSVDCNDGANLNARIRIRFNEGALSSAIGYQYSGSVTILITPE